MLHERSGRLPRRARSAARPVLTRLARIVEAAAGGISLSTASAPVAARSARCCRRRSERRGCHRESRMANSRRSRACRRCAKSLQALQPDGAVREQPACETRDLPPVLVGRAEGFSAGLRTCCAEQAGAGRIGPQDPPAVGRPQPGGQAARRIGRQSWIARGQPLKFRILHRNHMTARHQNRQPDADSVKGTLLSQAGSGRSTVRRAGGN